MTEYDKKNTYRDIEILNESCMIGLEKMKKDNKLVHLTVKNPKINTYKKTELLHLVLTKYFDST